MPQRASSSVLLLNLGGPDSLDAVEPFLANLFSDRGIIPLSPFPFLQGFIARRIASARSKKVLPRYEAIGGRSPILPLTVEQARALEGVLAERRDGEVAKVYVAMRYWHPFIEETLERMVADGVARAVVVPLYPHYSKATTGSCFSELRRAIGRVSGADGIDLTHVSSWFDQPGYLEALAESVRAGIEALGSADDLTVLFSAHSLPQSFIDEGDPYLDHIKATVAGVKERLKRGGLDALSYTLAFQSRSGPVQWMEPATDDEIVRLAGEGCKRMLVVPVSFVSDHIETLYEIDVQYKELALEKGIEDYLRAPSLNSRPAFIDSLADIVKEHE